MRSRIGLFKFDVDSDVNFLFYAGPYPSFTLMTLMRILILFEHFSNEIIIAYRTFIKILCGEKYLFVLNNLTKLFKLTY